MVTKVRTYCNYCIVIPNVLKILLIIGLFEAHPLAEVKKSPATNASS